MNQGPLDIQIQQADLSQPKMYEAYLKKETAKHVKLVLELCHEYSLNTINASLTNHAEE